MSKNDQGQSHPVEAANSYRRVEDLRGERAASGIYH